MHTYVSIYWHTQRQENELISTLSPTWLESFFIKDAKHCNAACERVTIHNCFIYSSHIPAYTYIYVLTCFF